MAPDKKLNFLNIIRPPSQYRPKEERIRDYREVEIFPEVGEIRIQAERCMDCGIPFCHSLGCPLHNIIPEINAAVAGNDWDTAWKLLRSRSNFPEFTSRVCPALCEAACTAGLELNAVSVRHIEYTVVEEAFRQGRVIPRGVAERNGLKVAVIGAGPSGLAAADELNQSGFEVTVYEKNAYPGGLLRYGIPDFKLEKTVVERRIALLEEEGIHFECGTEIGRDLSGEYLKKRFDYLVLAIGTPQPRDLKIPNRDLNGIHFAVDYLSARNRVVSGEMNDVRIHAKGKKVLVIGGGDTGSDCIGTAHREEAKSVTQIELLPEPPVCRHCSTPWPEYPYMKKTSSSHKEGAERLWSVTTTEFRGENGQVSGVKASRVQWIENEAGRPVKWEAVPDSEFVIDADLVLLAMGFTGVPSTEGIAEELNLGVDSRGKIMTDSEMRTTIPGIFATGDCISGPSLVVRAIAAGRRCAESIRNESLRKEGSA